MDTVVLIIKSIHVLANLIWVGSILSVGLLLGARFGEPQVRGELALDLYKKLATPGFIASFAAGTLMLVLNVSYYFGQTKFMHGKLLFALIVIALHHVIGATAKKLATGKKDSAGAAPVLTVVLLVSAVAAAFFAVLKPF